MIFIYLFPFIIFICIACYQDIFILSTIIKHILFPCLKSWRIIRFISEIIWFSFLMLFFICSFWSHLEHWKSKFALNDSYPFVERDIDVVFIHFYSASNHLVLVSNTVISPFFRHCQIKWTFTFIHFRIRSFSK